MNRKINLRFVFAMLVVGIILVTACSSPAPTEPPPTSPPVPTSTSTPAVSPVDLVKAYQEAFNRGDVPAMMDLVTEDVSWSFPSAGIDDTGRQDVQMVYEFTSGLNTKMQLTGCQSSGDTVTCKLTFGDECVRSSGVDAFPGEAVFTIDQDKIRRTLIDIPSDVLTSYWAWSDKYSAWFEKTYPSQWTQIGAGQFTFDRETGAIMGARCKEFAATLQTGQLDLVKAFETAWNQGDFIGLTSLLTEDVSYQIVGVGGEITNLQDFLVIYGYSHGLNNELHLTGCQASGDKITCKMIIADDCVRSSEVGKFPGEADFTINQDKIKRIALNIPSDALTPYWEFWGDKFQSWYEKTYPTEWANTQAETAETGAIIGGRCKEYAETLKASQLNTIKAYEAAFNRGDVPGLMALFAEGASFKVLSDGTEFTNLQDIQTIYQHYSGVKAEDIFSDCQASDSSITCKVDLSDDCSRSSGVNQVSGEAVFTFTQDKIKSIFIDVPSNDMKPFVEWMGKFSTWFEKTYPTESAKVDAGATGETGAILGKRCKDYAATLK